MSIKVVLIDGYIDDPAALGVPPYISPIARAVAGAAIDAGAVYKINDDLTVSGAIRDLGAIMWSNDYYATNDAETLTFNRLFQGCSCCFPYHNLQAPT